MNRIIRTALASVGAAVVITGGGLGVAYATTPPAAPTQTSSTGDNDQVAALNQAADDLLTKIATLEKQLASTPDPTPASSTLEAQEAEVPATDTAPATRVTTTTAQTKAAASATRTKTDDADSEGGNDSDD
jgi:gamma-glutamylcysteine synthetase